MAANKFATLLHRNTNKLTLILVYTFLEWVLIFLLLLNSLFSYLIIKFADYFGLEKPCLWCSRLDHLFEPSKFQNSHRSLICEAHAVEISKLGYCSNHRKLAESQDLCENCSSSAVSGENRKKFVFFPWMNKLGVLQDKGIENAKCSCCGVDLEKTMLSPGGFIKPFWGDTESNPEGNLIRGDEVDDEGIHSDGKRSDFEEKQGINEGKTEEKVLPSVSGFGCNESDKPELEMAEREDRAENDDANRVSDEGVMVETRDLSGENQTQQHLEFYIDQDACHLIPIEKEESNKFSKTNVMEEEKNYGDEDFVMEFDNHVEAQYELVLESRSSFEEKVPLLPILECEEDAEASNAELEAAELYEIDHFSGMLEDPETEKVPTPPPIECLQSAEEMESHNIQEESEAAIQMQIDETEPDISIGTEIPDHETVEHIPSQDSPASATDDSKQDEEQQIEVEFRSVRVETREPELNNHLSFGSEDNDIEEEKTPDTPTSVESGHHFHRKFLPLERRDTEESIDGTVTSEVESIDGVFSVEKLKSALKAERKALNELYAELEEERSASAIAANQTMAMINRLQEEKAAMQMEALQYQRMMEEQSEYDQEALQLMNELMVKRDKERAELEKELELYRKKVEDYGTRERLVMVKRRKESTSCGEESDGVSVDLNHENGFGSGSPRESGDPNTPIDAVLYLEEERLLILDQLKVLEEKLFSLSEPEDDEDEKEHLHHENGNGHHFEANGKHEKRVNGTKAKRLLPLFDATEGETEEVEPKVDKHEVDLRKLAVEDEVEHVYERLQALEEDKEFLKHCVTSLKKGDKGILLLQEILQHLRDLRHVETRARTMENGLAYYE